MTKIPKQLKTFLEKTGITLDEEYQNNSAILKWSCPKGCNIQVSWRTLNKKQGCPNCAHI